jgi:uncharacterized protein
MQSSWPIRRSEPGVEIASADMPTGVGGAANAEYVPNHIVSSRTTLYKIYHDAKRPSHLLLPAIQTSDVYPA